jgi:hypothetical protein
VTKAFKIENYFHTERNMRRAKACAAPQRNTFVCNKQPTLATNKLQNQEFEMYSTTRSIC